MRHRVAIFFASILVVVVTVDVKAQSIWGKGLILQSDPKRNSVDIPKVALFSSAEGTNVIDSIYFDGNSYYGESKKFQNPATRNFAGIYAECLVPNLAFFEESPQYVAVFIEVENTMGWLKKIDLERIGWKAVYYIDIITPIKDASVHSPSYYPLASGTGLNLREGPGTHFRTIKKLAPFAKSANTNVFEIQSEGVREGNWLKVTVRQYDQSDCQEDMPDVRLIGSYIGWVKAIDDMTGAPNIWMEHCCEFL